MYGLVNKIRKKNYFVSSMESETRALNSWQGLPETRISSVEFRTSLIGTFSSVGINEILSVQFMDAPG
jgi:hypothetical protein